MLFYSVRLSELSNKVDELTALYNKIKSETQSRNQALEETLGVSEKFWDDMNGLMGTLKELQETLDGQDPPALRPSEIREQQETLEVGGGVGVGCVGCGCVCGGREGGARTVEHQN